MRTLSPAERAVAGYQWLTVAEIAFEMKSSRQTVINMIKDGAFGLGNVTRWRREYRVKPEGFEAYKEREAEKIGAADAA